MWCIAHELDLVIQSLMNDVMDCTLYQPLLSYTSCLRRQSNLINDMGSKCPIVCSTLWRSLGTATKCFISNRENVVNYTMEKQ